MSELIKYEVALKEVKAFRKDEEARQDRLGEICDRLEPKYGEDTLKRFSEEVGYSYNTLKHYRTVYRAYDEKGRRRPFSIRQELAAHPKRQEILEHYANLTKEEARKKKAVGEK